MRPTTRCMSAINAATRQKTYGFIGLGRMGSEMAFNLFSKTASVNSDAQFWVCDALPDAAQAFASSVSERVPGLNVHVASSPAEIVAAANTVVTMLPSSPEVKKVYSEAGGILSGLRALSHKDGSPTLCIDSTTLDVEVARSVAGDVIANGAEMVDAPVSGGVSGARAGTLSFLVGGTHSSFSRAEPVLAHMGSRIWHVGPSGAGLGAKLVNNLILGSQQLAVGEGMLLAQRLGLDPRKVADVVNSSTGACWSSRVNNPVPGAIGEEGKGAAPCERDYEGGFATALMLKDMKLATALAAKHNTGLPLGEAAERIYADALIDAPEYARKDFSSMFKYLAERTK